MPEMTRSRMERADAVRLERLRLRLLQEDVGRLCGHNQATISRAEQGVGSDQVYDAIERALAQLAQERA